jgi:hypothetical protein
MMGVDQLHYYDLYAPLVASVNLEYTPEQAEALVLDAVKPLGPDYRSVVQRAFSERWIALALAEPMQSMFRSSATLARHAPSAEPVASMIRRMRIGPIPSVSANRSQCSIAMPPRIVTSGRGFDDSVAAPSSHAENRSPCETPHSRLGLSCESATSAARCLPCSGCSCW